MNHAKATFDEAFKLIGGDRRQEYGEVSASFGRVAKTWSGILGHNVTPSQVALCMVALKLCREANKHKPDNLYDAAGYIGLLAEIEGV